MNRYKPGPGWSPVGIAPVWDHDRSGLRVHASGICLLPDGCVIIGSVWPESQSLNWFVRINGGNRRRGAMAWAISKLPDASDLTPEKGKEQS